MPELFLFQNFKNHKVYVASFKIFIFNQFGHKRCRHRLDMGRTNVHPAKSKYCSEVFSPGHIKLTNNNPNKDF